MRTKQEILEYLLISEGDLTNVDLLIQQATIWEKEYEQIQNGIYGYALESDFVNSPFILEDEDLTEIKEIKRKNGLVLYKITNKEE